MQYAAYMPCKYFSGMTKSVTFSFNRICHQSVPTSLYISYIYLFPLKQYSVTLSKRGNSLGLCYNSSLAL